MSHKNVLIIGSSGSLGQGICNSDEIASEFSIYGTYFRNKKKSEKIKYIHLDITNPELFDEVNDIDFYAAILIAGTMPAQMEGYHYNEYISTNISGTLNVLEFCRRKRIEKLIYIMTFSDRYNKFYTGEPILSDEPVSLNYTGDHALYSISKVTACELIEHYHQQFSLQTIIFRIPTVYCCDNNFNYYVDGVKKEKAYVKMIKNIINNKKIEIWGNPKNSKDMPYIKDFSRLIYLALNHKSAQGMFNAGTGSPVSLEVLVNKMIEVFSNGNKVEKIYYPNNPSQPNFTFDMSKTYQTFLFEPKYEIKDLLLDIKENLGEEIFMEVD